MWESFYFSKDCLSRDERRKRKIGKEKERDTFHRGWNPFSNGSFDLSKEKRRKRRGKGIRCARGRHLGEYLCLVFAKHKRGMGMAERERERDSFRAKETSSAKTLPRTSESSRTIARVNIENSPVIESLREKKRESSNILHLRSRILTVTSVCLIQKFFLVGFFPFPFSSGETAVEEVVHRSFQLSSRER